ncbi:MAG: molecular chaperone DnaJ [Nanoarchaeota archaeon]|nr:molecular chaperone DnaJ [Nanoarchaeota archaeon]
MTKKDYYEILGVRKDSSKADIKKAYKKLALKYHPDRGGDAEKFKEISEAYAVLSDNTKKETYDQFGHQGFDQRYSQEDIFRNANFQDIFSEIFGNQGGFGGSIFDMFFGGSRQGHREQRGSDLQYEMEIEFEEAAFGTEKEITIPRTEACKKCDGSGSNDGEIENCEDCNGTGQVNRIHRSIFGMMQQIMVCRKCNGSGKKIINPCKECSGSGLTSNIKTIKVKIPAGVDNGNQIRLSNEGNVNEEGKHPGDLFIIVYVKPHKVFRREENDIHIETSISVIKAILGGEIKIPTLKGNTKLKIPSGTQSHTLFRLKNEGIPYVNSKEKGDQYVKVLVDVPKKINRKQKELLEKFEKESKKKFGLF